MVDGQARSEAGLPVGALAGHPVLLLQALLHGGTDAQRKRWLPGIARGESLAAVAYRETGAGEEPGNWSCIAQRTDTGWVLSGAKQGVWFAGQATLLAVAARITDAPGGLGWFVIEKPALAEACWAWDSPHGGRITGEITGGPAPGGVRRDSIRCDRLHLPADALIGETHTPAHGIAVYMTGWSLERLHLSAMAIGAMQGAYERSWRATVGRMLGGRQGLDSPVIRQHLATMAVRLHASRQLAYRTARLLARGGPATAAALSLWYAVHQCESTSKLMRTWLSEPGSGDAALWRAWRQVSALPLLAGSNDVLALSSIAPDLLR
ncbi:MAG: acyl-CoA dehydrogenase [Candidatus Sericytochromatia bacterium]|nr:acyl-CoA dehydrogenase [Candidatus Sericytochromatia bacterium]